MQVIKKTIKYSKLSDWQNFLICSDVHFGESACDVKAFKADLKKARERNARIIIDGDLMGMILPKDQKRYSPSVTKNSILPFDAVINETISELAEILLPYADLIDMIGMGNHEVSIVKYHSIDVISMLIRELSRGGKFTGSHGGITGFLRYQFDCCGHRKPFVIHYHHGAGGSAPMSKGMIGMQRTKIQWLADMYIAGHCHNRWSDSDSLVCLNSKGTIEVKDRRTVKSGNYRLSYPLQDQKTAANIDYTELFQAQVKPIGGVFVKVRLKGSGINGKKSTQFEQIVEV